MTAPVSAIDDVIARLDLEPLDERHAPWHVPNVTHMANGRALEPLASLRAMLLFARDNERLFLSGHVGSGKSTELRRLLRDPEIQRRFFVVDLAVRGSEASTLTSYQLLFIIAVEIFDKANKAGALGKKRKRWETILERLDAKMFGASGVAARRGDVSVELDLVFFKLRQQLAIEDARRVEFRKFAESEGSILVDLIDALVEDVTSTLLEKGAPLQQVLVVVDDTDKVREQKQIVEIFETNRSALVAPRVPILLTIPASVTFGGPTTMLGSRITHLRPVQVLRKTVETDPMAAKDAEGVDFLKRVLVARQAHTVFDADVIEQAAVYSGGVLRDFFRLLRDSAIRASAVYGLTRVDADTFTDVLVDARNDVARTLFAADRSALRAVRATHDLEDKEQLALMNSSLVLEYNHEGIWWEASPLLWKTLEPAKP